MSRSCTVCNNDSKLYLVGDKSLIVPLCKECVNRYDDAVAVSIQSERCPTCGLAGHCCRTEVV